MDDTDPTNIVSFPGVEKPQSDPVRDMADYAAAQVMELARLAEEAGQEPAAVVVVCMTKGAGIVLPGWLLTGPEEGMAPLYVSHAGNFLLKAASEVI